MKKRHLETYERTREKFNRSLRKRIESRQSAVIQEGAEFADLPAVVAYATPVALTLAHYRPRGYQFGTQEKEIASPLSIRGRIEDRTRHIKTPLRWMKPDGKGGLIPK